MCQPREGIRENLFSVPLKEKSPEGVKPEGVNEENNFFFFHVFGKACDAEFRVKTQPN